MRYSFNAKVDAEIYERMLKVDSRLACFKPMIDAYPEGVILSDLEIADLIRPNLAANFSVEDALSMAFNIGLLKKRYSREEFEVVLQNPWRPRDEHEPLLFTSYSFPDSKFFDEIEQQYHVVYEKFFNRDGDREMGMFLSKVTYVLRFLRIPDSTFTTSEVSRVTSYTVMSPAVQLATIIFNLHDQFPDGIVSAFEAIPKKRRLPNADSYLEAILGFIETLKGLVKKLPIEAQTYLRLSGISF